MTYAKKAPNPYATLSPKCSASMPDLRLPKAAWDKPTGGITKRKRSDTNVDIATDTDSQVDRFERRNTDDDNDSIDLTPSHRIPEVLGSAATESTPSISTGGTSRLPNPLLETQSFQSPRSSRSPPYQEITSRQFRPPLSSTLSSAGLQTSKQSNLAPAHTSSKQISSAPGPRSSNLAISPSTRHDSRPGPEALSSETQQVDPVRKWDPKEWEAIEFDSDEENMSLAITMKLAYDLSLLKSFLEIYRKFNIHLGGKPNSRTLAHFDHPRCTAPVTVLTQTHYHQTWYPAPATEDSSA